MTSVLNHRVGTLPGGPAPKLTFQCRRRTPSLTWELRPHMPQSSWGRPAQVESRAHADPCAAGPSTAQGERTKSRLEHSCICRKKLRAQLSNSSLSPWSLSHQPRMDTELLRSRKTPILIFHTNGIAYNMWPFMTGFLHFHDDVHKILPCISNRLLLFSCMIYHILFIHHLDIRIVSSLGLSVLLGVFVC